MPKSVAKKSQEYRDRIKADPVKYQQKLEKDRERYHRKKERGIVKPISEVSRKEKERISWRILSCFCSSPNGFSCFDPQVVTFQKEGSVALSQGPPAQHNTSTNVLQRIDEVNDRLTGNWCVIIYDGDAFPGIIQEVDATDHCILVKTMSAIGSNRFFWPMRHDVILVSAPSLQQYSN